MEGIIKIIQTLRTTLKQLEEDYYSGNASESDDLYDYHLRSLVALEEQYPELKTEDSPTQRVGFYGEDNLNVPHEYPMLSLENAFNQEDLNDFWERCEKSHSDIEYILEPKIDGASISLIYEDSYLNKALSRGNGEHGEDLTRKILHIPEIPIRLKSQAKGKITIRGEIYIKKSDFEQVKQTEEKAFANHRNFVSGCLRLKKPEQLNKKRLRLRAYQLLNPESLGITSQKEVLEKLKSWGFEIQEELFVSRNKQELENYIQAFKEIKTNSDIPYDGLVIKVNKLNLLEDIGHTSKFPKWATAYKYPSLVRESKLLEIIPTVGRTGKITYSARIESVEIDGSVVQFATLHNANYIQNLDLRIGDYVSVYKSGEIVPRIVGFSRVKREPNLEKWKACVNCPSCGIKLVTYDNLDTQFCTNDDCLEKKYARLNHWVSRNAADIEGLSLNIIKKLSSIGILKSISDLYKLKNHKEKIINSDLQIKEKLFTKLSESIEKSKTREFKHLLFGLGINFVGEEASFLITQKYPTLEKLKQASVTDLQGIKGIGNKSAEAVWEWFQNLNNLDLLEELKSFGLFCYTAPEPRKIVDCFLTGKRIVITGKLSKSREQFSSILSNKYGAIVNKDITKNTDYLLAGEEAGSKLQKAHEKGIKILQESNLLEKLGSDFWD